MASISCLWSAWVPWLMLIRNASAPVTMSWRITSGVLLAGPKVARMRTFRLRGTKRLAGVSLLGIDAAIAAKHDSSTRKLRQVRCGIGCQALEPAPQPNPRE